MKEDFKIGKIDWFGGWNRKTCRTNNFGVIKYGENKEAGEELIKIYHFSDNTKDLNKDDYETLKGKYIISFKENDTRNIFLLENEEVFNNFSIEELQEIILKYINMDLKNNFFVPVISLMLKAIITKEGEFSFLYKNGILELFKNDFLCKIIADKEFCKYFGLNEEFILLSYLKQKNIEAYDLLRRKKEEEEKKYKESIELWGHFMEGFYSKSHFPEIEDFIEKTENIENFLKEKTRKKFLEFEESFNLIKEMIPYIKTFRNGTKADLEYKDEKYEEYKEALYLGFSIEKPKQRELEIIENANIDKVKKYIQENIKFENCKDIKDFIEYISKYNFAFELEDIFMEKILKFVEKELENSNSLRKFLYYFDGQITFNKEENNKLYDDLRKELLNKNFNLESLITDLLFNLNSNSKLRKKDRNICLQKFEDKTKYSSKKFYYNRIYYSHIKDENLKLALEKNVLSIYDFKDEKNNCEVLSFLFNVFLEEKNLKNYNYTLVTVPSSSAEEKIGFFNLVKLFCLTTGAKNGYGILKTKYKSLPKRMKGTGIKENLIAGKVRTQYAILFDDICTSGETLYDCEVQLKKENRDIQIPFYIAFGKTLHKKYINLKCLFDWKEENKSKNNWFIKIKIHIPYSKEEEYYTFQNIEKKEIEKYSTDEDLFRRKFKKILPKKYCEQLALYSCTFINANGEEINCSIRQDFTKYALKDLASDF